MIHIIIPPNKRFYGIDYIMQNEYFGLIVSGWRFDGLTINTEDGNIIGNFNGYMDLSIRNENKETSVKKSWILLWTLAC